MSTLSLPEESDYVPQQIDFAVRGLTNYLPKGAVKMVFGALKSNVDRFNYIGQIPEINQVIDLEQSLNKKDPQVAEDARKEGNELFKKESYLTAAQAYSKSVVYAQNDAENVALAYGNRSAAWFYLKRYGMCLADINLAIKHKYPIQQMYKLYERQAKCYIALNQKMNALNSIIMAENSVQDNKESLNEKQLAQRTTSLAKMRESCNDIKETNAGEKEHTAEKLADTNDIWGNYSRSVDLEFKNDIGRDVVAAKNINVGEPLLIENPYSSVLLSDHYYNHCYECYSRPWAPVPCPECATVIYCSAKCQQTSWEKNHKWECHYQNYFTKLWCGRIGHLAARIIQDTPIDLIRACVDGSFSEDPESLQVGVQDGKYTPDFVSIYSLSTKGSTRTAEGLFDFAVFAYFLTKVLNLSGCVFQEDNRYVGTALIKILQILQNNSQGILELLQPGDAEKPHPAHVGIGIYPSAALVNHSCYPNADLTYKGATAILRAVRNIYNGESITFEYLGISCLDIEPTRRQAIIRANFGFICCCDACKQKYPVWQKMDDQMPWFHCTECRADLDVSDFKEDGEEKYVPCSHCGSKQDVGLAIQELQASHENFARGMDLLLNSKHNEALPLLITHLRTMQRFISMPWRDLAACQKAIITCYKMKGNIRQSFIDAC